MTGKKPFQSPLFRSAALARAHSGVEPEVAVPLVSPLNWLALLAIALLLGGILAWLFLGTVEHLADGRGLVIRDSQYGIFEVAGTSGGKLAEVLVKEGDTVQAGQTIATFDRTELHEQIAAAESLLAEWKGKKDGDVGPKLVEVELNLRELERKYQNEREVRSERAGRVIEVVVSAGNVISPGRTILRLESLSGDYEVLAYVSAPEGKKIRPGMMVRVVPAAIGSRKHDHLLGRVDYVSTYPVTRDYLVSELGGNGKLADFLLEGGSPIEVEIALLNDPATGAYRWSSARGSKVPVESGLLVDAFVVLEEMRPISLLWPFGK